MAITITIHTTVYAPWLDGADERERVDSYSREHVITDEDIREAIADGGSLAHHMTGVLTGGCGSDLYAVYASDAPRVNERTSYSAEPYEHPHTRELTETTHHLSGPEWTYPLAREVAAIANWNA